MDVEQFIRDPALAQSVVGKTLNSLLWPPDVQAQMTVEPDVKSLHLAEEIVSDWRFEV